MTKQITFFLIVFSIIFYSCNDTPESVESGMDTDSFDELFPAIKTSLKKEVNLISCPSHFWQDRNNPSNNFFITGLGDDIVILDKSGNELHCINTGEINSIDTRYGINYKRGNIDICGASRSSDNHILLYEITGDSNYLNQLIDYEIPCTNGELNGFCFYSDKTSNGLFLLYSTHIGILDVLKVDFETDKDCCFELVKSLNLPGATGKMLIDDHFGYLYAEGENTFWKYNIAGSINYSNRKQVYPAEKLLVDTKLTGISLYDEGDGDGYIILSTEDNSIGLFERKYMNRFLTGFNLNNDGNTKGISISKLNFNKSFDNGFLSTLKYNENSSSAIIEVYDWNQIKKYLKNILSS